MKRYLTKLKLVLEQQDKTMQAMAAERNAAMEHAKTATTMLERERDAAMKRADVAEAERNVLAQKAKPPAGWNSWADAEDAACREVERLVEVVKKVEAERDALFVAHLPHQHLTHCRCAQCSQTRALSGEPSVVNAPRKCRVMLLDRTPHEDGKLCVGRVFTDGESERVGYFVTLDEARSAVDARLRADGWVLL